MILYSSSLNMFFFLKSPTVTETDCSGWNDLITGYQYDDRNKDLWHLTLSIMWSLCCVSGEQSDQVSLQVILKTLGIVMLVSTLIIFEWWDKLFYSSAH